MARKAQGAAETGSDFEKGQGPATRTERDSMGAMEVPIDALWGASTQRAVLNFPISGTTLAPEFLRSLGLVKWAAAMANKELGVLKGPIADAVGEAALSIYEGEHLQEFPLDVFQTGSGTSTNTNANEVISHLATQILGENVHPNDHVNFGQSSNDVIPTTMHVAAVLQCEHELIPALEALHACLARKAKEFDHVVKVGRTHLQDAVPIRLGQEFSGYARQVELSIRRVRQGLEGLLELAQGGTAVGTGLNAHPDFGAAVAAKLEEATGFRFIETKNHFEAQGSRDAYVFMAGALDTVAASLMKVANDIRLMGSGPDCGLGELQLPAIQPGSSIMPGKVNPVICEAVTMVGAHVTGNNTAVRIGGQWGQLDLNVMLPMMAHNLLESIRLLASVSHAFVDKCLDGITANEARATAAVERSVSMATALNPLIGYDKAAKIAKQSQKEGKTVREIAYRDSGLTKAQVDEALDPKKQTIPSADRVAAGGG
ncbi:MAG TPA: class II fumarate hydratase [Candidatus Thermoplasmatota archaeon]|nr:class II fumarate hydratase [Candidatus Thermoplasmatota archaeon]